MRSDLGRLVGASSTERRNTCIKSLRRRLELYCLAWSLIQLTRHRIELRLRVYRQVSAFGEILSQQTIGILVGPRCQGFAGL